jgi:hypothetical protein
MESNYHAPISIVDFLLLLTIDTNNSPTRNVSKEFIKLVLLPENARITC